MNKIAGGNNNAITGNKENYISSISGGLSCTASSYYTNLPGHDNNNVTKPIFINEDDFFKEESIKLAKNNKIFKYFPLESSWKIYHMGELIIKNDFSFENYNMKTKLYNINNKNIGVLIIEQLIHE